jgi:hypothetical protein
MMIQKNGSARASIHPRINSVLQNSFPLDGAIDEQTGDIRVTITQEMRDAARNVAHVYNHYHIAFTGAAGAHSRSVVPLESLINRAPAYQNALATLKSSTYEANPHLDPANMRDAEGSSIHSMRENMERASAGPLNGLVAQEASELGVQHYPVPFGKGTGRRMG